MPEADLEHLTVWVNSEALAAMTAEALRAHPDETGGMLLGWEVSARQEIVVTTTIGPGPSADHHPHRFTPDSDWQQNELERVYRRTETKITYLGDWHVHPEGGFGMSRRDRRTMQDIATAPEARCSRPLMGLLAPTHEGDGYRFGVWTWQPCRIPWHRGHTTPLRMKEWEPTIEEDFWSPH